MIFQHQNMSIRSSVLVFLLTSLIATQSASAQIEPTYFLESCDTSFGNYTAKSTYATNLKTALSTLQQQSSATLFYNTSAGSGAGEVHAQYYCRGDIGSDLCSACISQASDTILTNCKNIKSAYIWYDVCSLRYHNESMFGVLHTKSVAYGWNFAKVSDPDSFSVILNSTLETLIKESAYGNDFRRFAVGEAAVSTETTYFLVQCSPDLSAVDCDTCLWITYAYINRCCRNWPVAARVFFPSCQMRYSDLIFYSVPPSPPPPQQVSSPPPPSSSILEPPPPPAVTTFSPTGK